VTTRIVLRSDVTRDDIDEMIARLRFRLMNLLPATTSHPSQMIVLTEDRSHILQLVDDEKLGLTYVVPNGPDVEGCVREVRAALATYAVEEIQTLLAHRDANERALGVKLAALCLPADEANRALRAARGDSEGVVRDAATLALPYVELPRAAPRPRASR